jgi:POT family proton-dependent oligopeptide transporter
MIGVYTLSMFLGSVISGRLGGLYSSLSPISFWTLHAGLAMLGAILLTVVSPALRRLTGVLATDGAAFQ